MWRAREVRERKKMETSLFANPSVPNPCCRHPTFLFFLMKGCPPCEAFKPEAKRMQEDAHKKGEQCKFHVRLITTDEHPKMMEAFGISFFPTILLFVPTMNPRKSWCLKVYEGPRDAKSMEMWIEDQNGKHAFLTAKDYTNLPAKTRHMFDQSMNEFCRKAM